MNLPKAFLLKIAGLTPFSLVNRVAGPGILLPYHHVVSDQHLPHIKNLYSYKNVEQFSNDLDWLLTHRVPLSADEVAKSLVEKKPIRANSFLLSFDDGFREIYDVVAPMLLRKGVPAVFFINPSFIDNRELFFRCKISLVLEKLKDTTNVKLNSLIAEYLSVPSSDWHKLRKAILKIHYKEKEKVDVLGRIAGVSFSNFLSSNAPFLSSGQVKELHLKGFTIGAHSMDHPHYGTISEDEQLKQTLNSMQYVQSIAPSLYTFFSFPHEDRVVRQSFFDRLLADQTLPEKILFGTQNQKLEGQNRVLHRFNAENPSMTLAEIAKAQIGFRLLRKILKRDKVLRD